MSEDNKQNSNSKSGKKSDSKFHSKHIKHDPQAESARAVFGRNQSDKFDLKNQD